MDFKQLDRGEWIAAVGGVLLGISLAMSWYTLGNRFATLGSCRGPHSSCSGWASLGAIRYLLLIAAIAPAILVWVTIRGHALSWPRGELTAVIALVALVLTIFRGVIDRPGMPPGEIGIDYGWWVGLLGGILILTGSIWRARESGPRRKPPGVL
jgi:hypothetical protein